VAELPLRHAFALGLLHGPTELLPVSSSGHSTLIPWLARWPSAELEPELQKSFEVALHAGTAVALTIVMREELAETVRELDCRGAALITLSLAAPVIVGSLLERPIERRLSGPKTIATGLLLGGIAMARADAGPQGTRGLDEAGLLDGLLLGLAQASALLPGVSRNGATLAAARARGFDREDSATLSWRIALPVILGATTLKGSRLLQRGVPDGVWRALTVGAGGAFLSTLVCAPLVEQGRRGRALAPFALYRGGLALAVGKRVLRRRSRR
jgi:undecaprenyl-diphosphatase